MSYGSHIVGEWVAGREHYIPSLAALLLEQPNTLAMSVDRIYYAGTIR